MYASMCLNMPRPQVMNTVCMPVQMGLSMPRHGVMLQLCECPSSVCRHAIMIVASDLAVQPKLITSALISTHDRQI